MAKTVIANVDRWKCNPIIYINISIQALDYGQARIPIAATRLYQQPTSTKRWR